MEDVLRASYKRKVDIVGRISIPSKIVKTMDIRENSVVLVYLADDKTHAILKKYDDTCVLCGAKDTVYLGDYDLHICLKCRTNKTRIKLVEFRYSKQIIRKGRRLVIPKKIRDLLNVDIGDRVQLTHLDNKIEIHKVD